jgi:hypothetical protein
VLPALLAAGCGSSQHTSSTSSSSSKSTTRTLSRGRFAPPPADNVYAYDRAGNLSPAVQQDRALVYVPSSMSNTVTVISQRTLKIVAQFLTGALLNHGAQIAQEIRRSGRGLRSPREPKESSPDTGLARLSARLVWEGSSDNLR